MLLSLTIMLQNSRNPAVHTQTSGGTPKQSTAACVLIDQSSSLNGATATGWSRRITDESGLSGKPARHTDHSRKFSDQTLFHQEFMCHFLGSHALHIHLVVHLPHLLGGDGIVQQRQNLPQFRIPLVSWSRRSRSAMMELPYLSYPR